MTAVEPAPAPPLARAAGAGPAHALEPDGARGPVLAPEPVGAPVPARAPLAPEKKKPGRGRRRALARVVRRALAVALAAVAIAGAALALRPRPVPVDLARAARGALEVAVEETGVARVKDRYLVSAPVAGAVSRQALEPGDVVGEADVLAEIAPVASPLLDERSRLEAEARLGAALSSLGQARAHEERAGAALGLSRQELERTRALVSSGAVGRQALEEAEFQDRMRAEELNSAVFAGKVAAEEVRRARAALARDGRAAGGRHVDVLAPASGRVLRVPQKSAGVVQAGAPLLEIGDDAALEVVVDLLTTDAVRVGVGAPVVVQGWGGERALAGRVRLVEPSAFTRPSALGVDEQRVNVVVLFTEPRDRWVELRDGYRVEARFVLWRSDDVLKVPNGAVFRRGDGWAVFRVDGGKARLTPVTIGHRGETEVEIVSGLSPGDSVAVHPGDRVKDGASVEAR